jgi:ankyrin repeat protein
VDLLLDRGADINEGNAFGKTALMYVAHYNLDNTVTLLLKRGADVSKRTDALKAMGTNIRFDSRTALMYAAENASEQVIRELIQAGSDTCATDSGRRDVWSYVLRNRRLSNDDRARVAQLIADKPCDRGGLSDQPR